MASIILPGNATQSQVLNPQTFSAGSNFNTVGTMPNNGAVTITPGTSNKTVAAGYHNGSGIVQGDANLVAGNILSGKSIFGVSGSVVQGIQSASGTATTLAGTSSNYTVLDNGTNAISSHPVYKIQVTGLSFSPTRIVVTMFGAGSNNLYMYDANNIFLGYANGHYCFIYVYTSNSEAYIFNTTVGDFAGAVTSSGFTLPVELSGTYNWWAYAN